MDKNTWVGFLLIAAIIVGFTMLNRPSKEQLAERQRVQDSIKLARMAELEAQRISDSLQYVAGNAAQTETISEEQQQAHSKLRPSAKSNNKRICKPLMALLLKLRKAKSNG